MQCLFRANMGDVKMMPFISYNTNIMRIFGHKIIFRKYKINSMSIRMGKIEYIMTQRDHKCQFYKCYFHLSTLSEFSCLTRNTIRDARNILQI